MADLHLLSPKGFRAAGVYAGIKSKPTNDVGLLVCDRSATVAAVFTTNRVFAAPVKVGREHVAGGKLRGVVVNAGNANACTGKQGERDAYRMCEVAAAAVGAEAGEMLPSSTGIIGHLLPIAKVTDGITRAAAALGDSAQHAIDFAAAILTTDTKRKAAATLVKLGRDRVTIAGVCKGSGMIGPRMSLAGPPHATMLAYLTTDATASPAALRGLFGPAAARSFNAVTVDDHTSTNDTAVLLASGASGGTVNTVAHARKFQAALVEVCQSLAYQIAADGEGATKVVRIDVTGARTEPHAQAIARAIANSPLVKCAMHGNDPNWGRIVSAAGLCGVPFDPDKSQLVLQGTTVFRAGRPVSIDAAKVSASLKAGEVVVDLRCGLGKASATVWTCDLSKEYVTINADYHT
ncbi:MAG TPA: bifunctional glutamate N-acetyltransferase/amino-acid acetyltransferase ArgJ [Tepidisphaeraceae bacterium]|nr:bifunctional glutamate N-acetyltransferase/amino-acid acetyltransferase ArgJ [Tepidisphaeraceae bacterium]